MAKKSYRIKKIISNDEINKKEEYDGNNKHFTPKKKLLLLFIFLIFVMITVGIYSVFISKIKKKNYDTIMVGVLKIDYLKGNTDLVLNSAYPIGDKKELTLDPYIFKITNSGNVNVSYKVKLIDDNAKINRDNCQNKLLSKSIIKFSINDKNPVLLENLKDNDFIVAADTLTPKETKDYKIRVWIDKSTTNTVLEKHFHTKVVVDRVNLNMHE